MDMLNRSLLTGFLPVQAARSAGMYLAGKIGPLRRLLMREASHREPRFNYIDRRFSGAAFKHVTVLLIAWCCDTSAPWRSSDGAHLLVTADLE